jgi:biopolymer transport protein ExbD
MKIPRRPITATIPSSAMGDIGFLLLIFFVVLARAHDDSHVQWQPARLDPVEMAGTPRASVAIDTGARVFLNGEPVAADQLAARLGAILGDTPAGDRRVFLKVHRETDARHFEPVIQAIAEAGGDLVHILEPEPETPSR